VFRMADHVFNRRRIASVRHKMVVAGIVLCLGCGLGFGVSTAFAAASQSYRTATTTIATVNDTLSVDGTLQPMNEAEAEFQVSGTVADVDVKVGEKVTAGQTIATLDKSQLEADLTEAESTLASAKAQLTEDENDEAGYTTAEDRPASTAVESASADAELTSAFKPDGSGDLSQDQAAIVADQHAVDLEMQVVASDLASVESECKSTSRSSTGTGSSGSSGTASGTTTAPTTTTTTTAPTTTTTKQPNTDTSSACASALAAANTAEQQVSADQQTLASAESELAKLLASEAASSNGSSASRSKTSDSSPSTGTSSSKSGSSSESAASGSSSSVSTDTPEQLANDESTIDSDDAAVVEAEQSLAAADLVSPISGTVESVGMAVGDAVTGGSSSDAVTIVDWKSYEVAASLTTSQVEGVKVGQEVAVTVDGIAGTLEAEVTRVGPVEESDSSFVYPVVMAVTSKTGTIPAGSAAEASIELAEAHDVLVVPTSAVHSAGVSNSYVLLDEKGSEARRRVTLGLVGEIYTQITSGLAKGDVVVLANPSESVPSSSSDSTTFPSTGLGSNSSGGLEISGAPTHDLGGSS
jgi:multidrug efflux pump subunit AcrA (membrane-fusion protein)